MLTQHLGSLHGYEQALTIVLAFGPFVLLAIVLVVRRRQDAAADDGADDGNTDDEDVQG